MIHVLRVSPDHVQWPLLVSHLTASGDARWVLVEESLPKGSHLIFLGAVIGERIAGSLTLKIQPVVIPATEWAGERDLSLQDPNGELIYEMFIQTFIVEEGYRRMGIGRALQEEGLKQTKQHGCYQMRSWSSLDKKENYQLKLGMGFGFHPEIQETVSGLKVSGGYFVKVV